MTLVEHTPEATQRRPRLPLGSLLALTAAGFLTIMLETMPAGILPQMSAGLGVTESAAGQFVSVYAIGSIVGAIPIITATMGWPRRHLLVAALAGYVVTSLVVAFSSSFVLTLGARFVAGVFAGVLWGIIAGVAGRLVTGAQRGRGLTIALAGTPIALAIGTPAGTLMASVVGWRFTFVAMAVVAGLVIVWAIVVLPALPGQEKGDRTPIRRVFTLPGLVPVLVTAVLYVAAHNLLYTYIAPFLAPVGMGSAVSAVLLVFGVASLLSLVITGALIDRHLRTLMIGSTTLFAVAMLALGFVADSPVAVFASAVAWGLAFGGAASLLQTAMMNVAGTAVDAAQSVMVTGWNIGIAGGGILGGALLSSFGPASLPWATFALVAIALIVVVLGRRHAFTPPAPEPISRAAPPAPRSRQRRRIRISWTHQNSANEEVPVAELSPIQPCLWFDNQAREAMEYYVDVFPNSRILSIGEYPDESLDENFVGMAGKVLNGQFRLNGVDFVCLDGGPVFTFNESISFVVSCADQEEIDRYWSRLSHVPESEQCGWCKDRFGLSWQIIPANMGELTRRPEQMQVMMQQKKIVIAELENA
ncbi:MFS transporter [Cryobacterium sp. AP23]